MKSAHSVDKVVAGTDVEVIGIGKLYLTVDLLEIHCGDTALNCCGGTNVHKHRGFDRTVDGLKSAATSSSLCFK
jgi:hypothetical protein